MTDLSDPSFSLSVILGIVAVALASYALWRQKLDRGVSVATFNLVRDGITTQREVSRKSELEWKKLRDIVQITLVVFGVVIVGIVLFALFIALEGKGTESRTSSSPLISQ